MALQLSTFLHQYWNEGKGGKKLPKDPDAVKFGIISTALINPAAIIHPVESHPGAQIVAIASRDLEKAKKSAKSYDIPKAYGSYEELLADPEVDAVYISLPNSMHAEWAIKAMKAGKHVLIEKPCAANAEEVKSIFEVSKSTNKVALEAFHWQFHPAAHVVKSIIDSGRYGKLYTTHATMTTPAGTIPKSNIRWQADLAGGSLMDMTYVVSSTRYFTGGGRATVESATARPSPKDRTIDEAMEAKLSFPDVDVESTIQTDMNQTPLFGIIPKMWNLPSIWLETGSASIYFYNFMMPHLYHYIDIFDRRTQQHHIQKHYSYGPKWQARSEPWWSTYRYQLEAFVDKVKGREPVHWISGEDSIAQAESLDAIYEKSGLGLRHGSLKPEMML